ncbi:MAG TPA: hypothetical protein VM577_19285 [Anaerovoracaceae bacterium]|nr:hypothetical protein [Anaerovoracaceae bacterium]
MNQTSPWVKFGVIAGLVMLVACLIFVIKNQLDLAARQEAMEKSVVEMKQLGDGIIRSQSQYVSKNDLDQFGKSLSVNLDLIQKDLDTLGANLQGINSIIAASSGFHGTGLPSTNTSPGDNKPPANVPDPYGYLINQQNLAINEPFGSTQVPFGQTGFSAWKDKPWSLDIYPRNYKVTTVIGQDEDGRHYTYNKFVVDVQGKSYTVPVQESKFEEVYPESKFRFSPRIYLGVDGGAVVNPAPKADLTPNVQVALFSYGKTKVDPDWSILGVGVGYETQASRPVLVVSPAYYNVGHHIPLINNLHVGATVSLDTQGGIGILGGVHVGL